MIPILLTLVAQVVVVTDDSWQGAVEAEAGWEKPETVLEWDKAVIGVGPSGHGDRYAPPNMIGVVTRAAWITAGEGKSCVLRRIVDVPKGFRRAELAFAADDGVTLFVNGEKAAGWDVTKAAWGVRGGAGLVDLSPFLVEGRNAIGAILVNDSGPWGFVAELRIDGSPFLPPTVNERLGKDALRQVDEIVRKLDSNDLLQRSEAAKALAALAEKHGSAMLATLQDLANSGSEEVKAAAAAAIERIVPPLDPPEGKDATFGYGRIDFAFLRKLIGAPDERQHVLIKWLMGAKALAMKNEGNVVDVIRGPLDGGSDVVWERAVRYAAFLECKALAPVLIDALKARAKTPTGAWAAAAIGRLGLKNGVEALKAASTCGYAPTERAAKRSLALLKK